MTPSYPDAATAWPDYENRYNDTITWYWQAVSDHASAWGYPVPDPALQYALYAINDLIQCFYYFVAWPTTIINDHPLSNILYYNTASTFDMGKLLNAMLAAKFDELTQFVGIEDAYRSAIWDQPFNSQFYAALAQGFRANL